MRIGAHESIAREGLAAAAEEVAAVLEGRIRVQSADEAYVLSPGEGIIIPPGQGSRWSALEEGSLLYRVLVRVPAAPEQRE